MIEDRFYNWAAQYISNINVPEERVVLTDFCIKCFTRWFSKFNERQFLNSIDEYRKRTK